MKLRFASILAAILSLVMVSCGPGQVFGPTFTPTATITPTPTSTLSPTATPTQTATPTPTAVPYAAVPRWMILGRPGHSVEILGKTWNYADDRWGENYGCIDYVREDGSYVFFEQCFAVIEGALTFDSQVESLVKADFETLEPRNNFSEVGQIDVLAKRLEDNSTKFVKVFEIIGTEKYLLLVEMNIVTDETAPLQTIYESQADVLDYVLQNSLEKSHRLPRATPTPLSPSQESFYVSFVEKLISESEASALYNAILMGGIETGPIDGTWETLGERVASKRQQVCRDFEDRTNLDVRWLTFSNCIFSAKDFPFEKIADYYKQEGDVVLESQHVYDDQFVLYSYNDGSTYFDAYLLHGEYVYLVNLESRTMTGEKPGDVFDEIVDDFLYAVLMTNVKN